MERRFGSETEYFCHLEKDGQPISATASYQYGDSAVDVEHSEHQMKSFYSDKLVPVLESEQGITFSDFNVFVKGADRNSDTTYMDGFMSNGGRFYLDFNRILEYATPEATSPFELCKYEIAADLLVYDALSSLRQSGEIGSFQLNRRSTDSAGNSWGYHENISVYREGMVEDEEFGEFLASFLAVRTIFAGAGGYIEDQYYLSPRAGLSNLKFADASFGSNTPIVRTKHSEDGDALRYQIVSSEAAALPETIYMRHSFNEIIALLYETNADIDSLIFKDPLSVARTVAIDYSMKNLYELIDGRKLTARQWLTELIALAETSEAVMQACSQDAKRSIKLLKGKLASGDSVFEWQKRKDFIDKRVSNSKDFRLRHIYDLFWDNIGVGKIHPMRKRLLAKLGGISMRAIEKEVDYLRLYPGQDRRAQRRAEAVSEHGMVASWTHHYSGDRIEEFKS